MTGVFVFCAAAGGTVLIVQFLLTLLGFAGHGGDIDVPDSLDHDFGADYHDASTTHDTLGLFKILTFRTIVAAVAFFGLAGLAAQSAEASTPNTLLVALAAGAAAMVAVYWMMRGLQELRADGTVRIQQAVGRTGTVYLRVPSERSGCGKIQFNLQNRTVEYSAVTAGPELPTGTKVVVVGVVDPTTLEVQAE